MYKCDCYKGLDHDTKQSEIIEILTGYEHIDHKTQIIIVFCKAIDSISICINTIKYKLSYGINKICICGLHRRFLNIKLKIAHHYLTTIERIPSKLDGVEFYVAKARNHKNNCYNNNLPSLLHLSYFQLLVNGISEQRIVQMVLRGQLPRDIFDRRLKCYTKLEYFGFSDLFNLWIPSVDNVIPSCSKPLKHLNIII